MTGKTLVTLLLAAPAIACGIATPASGASRALSDAEPSITIVPPAGAHVDSQDQTPPQYFRTAEQRPTLGIEGSGGTQVKCILDNTSPNWGPCGPPLAGCTAAVCASYRPASPLTGRGAGAMHDLAVELLDSDGSYVTLVGQSFSVDTTPPKTTIEQASVVNNPLRPEFGFSVRDDEAGDPRLATVTADCSFRPAGASPAWRRCASPGTSIAHGVSYKVPRRHLAYRFQVRGTDDLGRSTTVHRDYDAVPCTLRARPPAHAVRLASSGIFVRVSCDSIRTGAVGLWVSGVNGAHLSPLRTIATYYPNALHSFTGRETGFRFNGRLGMYKFARRVPPAWHSVSYVLAAGDGHKIKLITVEAAVVDASLSYMTFTLHR